VVRDLYLQIADRHIAETERLIERQEWHVQWLSNRGVETERARKLLATLKLALESFRAHRNQVAQHISSFDQAAPED